jgi:hypothetical protein
MFVIATSTTSTDATAFTDVLRSYSSGNTLDPEKYSFPATNARYISVTVNGNIQ